MMLTFCSLAISQIPQLERASDVVWSRSKELSIGKAAYDKLRANGQLYESPADLDYLNYLGNRVASFAETRLGINFYLTRSRTINAYATPGGYVGVNVGLVLATDNEHELAAVLAHETAHVSQEHIARMVLSAKNRKITHMAALAAGVLVAAANSDAGVASLSAAMASETQSQINDIRRHEIEADNVGRDLLNKAGFNELGMQTFFGKLYTPSELNNAPAYLLTHPLPQRRQAALDVLTERSKSLVSRDEYYLFKARIQAEFLSNEILAQHIREAVQSTTLQQQDTGHYLAALLALKKGLISEAKISLNRLKTSMRENRDVLLLQAKLALLNNHKQDAENVYSSLWKRYEGDSVIAYDYAQFLTQAGRLEQAEYVLSQAIDSTKDTQMYWLYGQVLEHLGKVAEQQRMLIRYYRQNGEYELALVQAQIAANRADLDWQTRMSFTAAQKELQLIINTLEEND